MTIGAVAVPLVAVWLAVTVLFQFRPFSQKFYTLDQLGLLPRWLFFTQGVGGYVLAVAVRFRGVEGAFGAWEATQLWPPPRWWHAIFYPDQALTGILWVAVDRLARRAERDDSTSMLTSTQAFATLRDHLRTVFPGQNGQLAVLRTDHAGGEPRRLFIAEFCGP
jgi:hypothetical protein